MEDQKPIKENDSDLAIDFLTSSAISKVSIKLLFFYLPILWLSGFVVGIGFYTYTSFMWLYGWITFLLLLPLCLIGSIYLFLVSCVFFSKLFLILVNLIHEPKEGIFLAEEGNRDFEFWRLRTELKKLGVWMSNNTPLPWTDALAFRWFGLKMDFSSHLHDAWVDVDFLDMGKNVIVGQAAVVMSSMVVGKYLIIKRVVLEDFAIVGGMATVGPGTIMKKDSLLGAASTTNFNQVLEEGWIYFGIPGKKLKANRYHEGRKDLIIKRDVDAEKKYAVKHEANIDDDKNKEIIKKGEGGK